jgi:hypothetical protein
MVEPTFFLLAFGFGMGALVGTLAGHDYIDFLGTGIVAMSVMFQSMMPAVINTIGSRYAHVIVTTSNSFKRTRAPTRMNTTPNVMLLVTSDF